MGLAGLARATADPGREEPRQVGASAPAGDAAAMPASPARRPLGTIMLDAGTLTSSDLMRALTIQTRENARLGDILRAHGMAPEKAIVEALAVQHQTGMLSAADGAPDPRLIDLLGPARCLSMGCLPWRRAGSVTLVACALPDRFIDHRPALEAVLGPVAMAVIAESELHRELL